MSTILNSLRAVRFSTVCIMSCLVLTACLKEPVSFEQRHGDHEHDDTANPGPNTSGGTGAPPANSLTGLWATSDNVHTETRAIAQQANIVSPQIQFASNGQVFNHWVVQSGYNATTNLYSSEEISTIVRGANSSAPMGWTAVGDALLTPQNYSQATDTQFNLNAVTGNGIVTWVSNGSAKSSEYMSGMGHFMGSADMTGETNPQVLVTSSGDTYLLSNTSMANGFGLKVSKRASRDVWNSEGELHRMSSNAFSNPGNFVLATMDGQNNVRALWVEEQLGAKTLKTATFTTATKIWSAVAEIHAHGMDLNSLKSGVMSGHGTGSMLNVLLYQKSGSEHGLFSIHFDGTTWDEPVRQDAQSVTTIIVEAPAFVANMAGNISVAWIERNATMDMIKARQLKPMTGWSAIEAVASVTQTANAHKINVALNAVGETTVVWNETTTQGSDILASHSIASNAAWSQKEAVGQVNNTGTIQSFDIRANAEHVTGIVHALEDRTGSTHESFYIVHYQ